jgi:hypothetical protein
MSRHNRPPRRGSAAAGSKSMAIIEAHNFGVMPVYGPTSSYLTVSVKGLEVLDLKLVVAL